MGGEDGLLKVENLHVYYGSIYALKGISLEVRKGEIVTLIGANGAGKTTTLRAISGLVNSADGRIIYDGKDITHLDASDIVALGISHCPEGRQLFGGLTVKENLILGAYLRKDKKEIEEDMERIFELFPILKERINQKAGTLSGGEQEMLAIARALMSKPRLLLLDEPSLGLAPLVVEKIFETIAEVRSSGTTVLLVEQNANMALEIADRGYVLETGKIVLSGSARSLKENEEVKRAYLGG